MIIVSRSACYLYTQNALELNSASMLNTTSEELRVSPYPSEHAQCLDRPIILVIGIRNRADTR